MKTPQKILHKPLIASLLAIGATCMIAGVSLANPKDAHELPVGPGCEQHMGMNGPVPPFLKDVALSETQQDTIFSILHNQEPLMRKKVQALQKTEDALRELALSDNYDEANAKKLADSAADMMAEINLLRTRTDHQLFFVLSDEQRKQAEERKKAFEKDHPRPFWS